MWYLLHYLSDCNLLISAEVCHPAQNFFCVAFMISFSSFFSPLSYHPIQQPCNLDVQIHMFVESLMVSIKSNRAILVVVQNVQILLDSWHCMHTSKLAWKFQLLRYPSLVFLLLFLIVLASKFSFVKFFIPYITWWLTNTKLRIIKIV